MIWSSNCLRTKYNYSGDSNELTFSFEKRIGQFRTQKNPIHQLEFYFVWIVYGTIQNNFPK